MSDFQFLQQDIYLYPAVVKWPEVEGQNSQPCFDKLVMGNNYYFKV